MTRDDIVPVIIGGDWSTYAIAREFHEAFGVRSHCICPGAIALIEKSRLIETRETQDMGPEGVLAQVRDIAEASRGRSVVLMANTDDRIELVEEILDRLPGNVRTMLPPHDTARQVSDKVTFGRLCDQYGLDSPSTEVVRLAGTEPIPPTAVRFPLVAKPAVSAEYVGLYKKGFQKVYFMHAQEELDRLWADLRGVGFAGDFLVQELIGGDDTYVDLVTMYVDSRGQVSLCGSANVLLEDHVPLLLGNPVAMLSRPMPQLWDQIANLLRGIGWRGFANFDLKRDPETGRELFMDFNPRIGASSYYLCPAGVNPMEVLVRDIVDGQEAPRAEVRGGSLYTRVPTGMLRRYVREPGLLGQVDKAIGQGDVHNPCRYGADGLSSRYYGWLMEENYVRKFRRYYPKPTDTSF